MVVSFVVGLNHIKFMGRVLPREYIMKKIFSALKAIIVAWFESEQTNTNSPMEQTDIMAGSNFLM